MTTHTVPPLSTAEEALLVPLPLRAFVDCFTKATHIVAPSEYPAVGHMFVLDRRAGRTLEGDRLEIRMTKLQDRKFDGCKLAADYSTDLGKMLPLWTFKSATATLIDDRLVLTVGHATIPKMIEQTWFLFNRTRASDQQDIVDGKLSIATTDPRVARAVRIVAMENEDPEDESVPDWALIEIEWLSSTPNISPIPMAKSAVLDDRENVIVGHSLGAPQLEAEVAWVRKPTRPLARLFADLGSGGSGSPVISNGQVIGVVRGNATFTKDQKRKDADGCKIVVQPQSHDIPNAHLVTLTSHIDERLSTKRG